MSASLFLAMVAVLVTAIGGRDQLIVARLSEMLGARPALLVVGMAVSCISSAVMAFGGAFIAASISDAAETMLVAIAMVVAAAELFWPVREKHAAEPTRSLAAAGIVLLARQIGDGPRFLVFALAAATASPEMAALGGALGGAGALAAAWMAGEQLERRVPLCAVRTGLGAIVLVAAIVTALTARGIL